MKNSFIEEQKQWAQKAQSLSPNLKKSTVLPLNLIECIESPNAWQGIAISPVATASTLYENWIVGEQSFKLDFGEYMVGHLELELETDVFNDSPIRIEFKFAELPYELNTPFSSYFGSLSKSWLQEEILVLDKLPPVIKLERRYAFRYLELKLGCRNGYKIRIKSIRAIAESSAEKSIPAPENISELDYNIDKVGVNTLKHCMQYVFEDGPKRDRRLWLGDLWLQAKVNSVSFQNYELVERSLYLLCSMTDEDGMVPGAMFAVGDENYPSNRVITYALLLAPMLYDHYLYAGNQAFCKELLPLAIKQHEIFRENIDENGFVTLPCWAFIDHNPLLRTNTAALGVYVYSLRACAKLCRELNLPYKELEAEAENLSETVRRRCWNEKDGLMMTDSDEAQYAWGTQAWLILSEIATPEQAEKIWSNAWSRADILNPKTPFLWSVVMLAGTKLGKTEKVEEFIHEYWGGMVNAGADTFWENYVPENPMFSSYQDPLMNSACHAWSCMPSYFIRKK